MEKNDCPYHPIIIKEDRKVVQTDSLYFSWEGDPEGYFLIKLEGRQICCGFVDYNHEMDIEFRGTNPDKIIKEIAKRKLCSSFQHMGYIASELMIAKNCLEAGKKYVQR